MTILTAALSKKVHFAEIKNEYICRGSLLRLTPGETLDDIIGYCIDAPEAIPAGGIVELSAGIWGSAQSEIVSR